MKSETLLDLYQTRIKKTETQIKKRLEHIKKRTKLLDNGDLKQLSMYGRGFVAGQVHRLIAERYFLETLLEE